MYRAARLSQSCGRTIGVDLHDHAESIQSRADLVAFIRALRRDLEQHQDDWENPNLSSFLEALAAWTEDIDGYFENLGRPAPEQPSWWLLGQMLVAAKSYE
jgi:hypothetical protein